jgi:hypothetical protein
MNNTIYLLIRQGIMGILLILAFGATVLAHNLFGVVGVMFAAAVIVPFGMVYPNPSNPNGPEEPGVSLLDASPNTQQ